MAPKIFLPEITMGRPAFAEYFARSVCRRLVCVSTCCCVVYRQVLRTRMCLGVVNINPASAVFSFRFILIN